MRGSIASVARFARCALERAIAVRSGDASVVAAADAALADARTEFHDGLGAGGPLGAIVARGNLGPAEAEVLAVAVAVEMDGGLQQLVGALTAERGRQRVEVGMLADLFGADHPGIVAVGPNSGLQRAALVSLEAGSAFSRSVVRVSDRVLWALAGDTMADVDLPVDAQVILPPEVADLDQHHAVLVAGDDRVRRRSLAAAALGAPRCLVVADPGDEDRRWAAVVREATLLAASVVVEAEGLVGEVGRGWMERADHLRWGISARSMPDLRRVARLQWRCIEAESHEPSDAEWREVVGDDVPRGHRLSADQLDEMRVALPAHGGDFAAAFRGLVSPKLEVMATHVRPRHGWDDLVLDPVRRGQLHDLADRYRYAYRVYDDWGVPAVPSRGLVALFSGPSGTGKTLGAEVLAGELGLDLYKLDLSSAVSKWVGETEKNLDELFAAAGAGNFVLFFDEADSIFAKRGAVNDSNDRWANLGTSYLLQRLESYDGLVVLATNYEQNIDTAFLRRIHVRIDFAMPDVDARREIWQRHLRSRVGLGDDVDVGWLATRFEIPGAAIKNIAVDAAFLAAAADEGMQMSHLVRAAAREMRKLGRLVTAGEFGEWFDVAATASGA